MTEPLVRHYGPKAYPDHAPFSYPGYKSTVKRSPTHDLLTSFRAVFTWGYGHYFVWAAAAATGAGLAVAIDHATGKGHIGDFGSGAAFAIPAATYLVTLWVLHYLPRRGGLAYNVRALVAAGLILLTPFTGQAVLLTGVVLALLTTAKVRMAQTDPLSSRSPEDA